MSSIINETIQIMALQVKSRYFAMRNTGSLPVKRNFSTHKMPRLKLKYSRFEFH